MASQHSVRPAKKAGSWYTKEAKALSKECETWLENSKKTIDNKTIKAIICPHAGYMYCGGTAAYSYHHVDPSKIDRVFILGPDHCGAVHSGKRKCMLSGATHWATPFGNISVDTHIISLLYETNCFDMLTMAQDATEHSMELIVPFLSFMFYSYYNHNANMNNNNNNNNNNNDIDEEKEERKAWNASFKIVPIMVGNCGAVEHQLYGKILSQYFSDDRTLFVISSDFCHWGHNYGYTPFDKDNYKKTHIYEYIKDLDFMAIQYLEKLDYNGFYKYLNQTQNTICGQHPLCVLLNAIKASSKHKNKNKNEKKDKKKIKEYQMRFVNYSQSSKVTKASQYSVSYAAGVLYKIDNNKQHNHQNGKIKNGKNY